MTLTFEQLRTANFRRRKELWPEEDAYTITDWSNAMNGEAGEAANYAKKIRRCELGTQRSNTPPEVLVVKFTAEVADTALYADLNATFCGVSLERIVVDKFNEVSCKYGSSVFL